MADLELFDSIVVGGGPAACSSAVYLARKKIITLLITESFGGQSIVSSDIQNWIGEPKISGYDLAKKLEAHVRAYPEEVVIRMPERVIEVKSVESSSPERICDFEVRTDKGVYRSKTVVVTAGAKRRKLGVLGSDKFEGRGISYCATCDAPLFVGKKVVVVGGGNAGFEAAHDLLKFAEEVYVIDSGDVCRADAMIQEEIKSHPKFKGTILNAEVLEVLGDQLVTGLKYKDKISNEEKVLEVGGIFVEIGSLPNSDMVENLVQLNEHKEIMINFKYARTSHPGVFAAGDVTDDPYKQNNISVGDGVRAALSVQAYLQKREKTSPAAEKR